MGSLFASLFCKLSILNLIKSSIDIPLNWLDRFFVLQLPKLVWNVAGMEGSFGGQQWRSGFVLLWRNSWAVSSSPNLYCMGLVRHVGGLAWVVCCKLSLRVKGNGGSVCGTLLYWNQVQQVLDCESGLGEGLHRPFQQNNNNNNMI